MGMDYVAIQEIVGHSDISSTMGMYAKPTRDDKVAEAKKMKDFAD
jgi:integrase